LRWLDRVCYDVSVLKDHQSPAVCLKRPSLLALRGGAEATSRATDLASVASIDENSWSVILAASVLMGIRVVKGAD